MNPFGFHASLLNISDGPMISFPNALAAAANIAALWLARFIPPEPRKNKTPKIMNIIPSINAASLGEMCGCEEKNQRSKMYVENANSSEAPIKSVTFRKMSLFMLFKLSGETLRVKIFR
jgi:hypothetical protein